MQPDTKRTNIVLVAGLAGLGLLAQGCVFSLGSGNGRREPSQTRLTTSQLSDASTVRSKGDVPSFSQAENVRLNKLGPDTTVEQFRKVFPEAVFRGSRSFARDKAVVYEVRDRRVFQFEGSGYGYIHDRPVFFRFVNGTLESWRESDMGENYPPAWWNDLDLGEETEAAEQG